MIVALVERKPRHRPSIDCNSRQPVSEQRCLAETGRRRDERQLRLGPSVQPVAQSRARHKTTPPLGDVKLGLEQRRNHDRLPLRANHVADSRWSVSDTRARRRADQVGRPQYRAVSDEAIGPRLETGQVSVVFLVADAIREQSAFRDRCPSIVEHRPVRSRATLLRDLRLNPTEARGRRAMSSSRGVNRVAQAQEQFDRVRELKMLELSIEVTHAPARLLKDR